MWGARPTPLSPPGHAVGRRRGGHRHLGPPGPSEPGPSSGCAAARPEPAAGRSRVPPKRTRVPPKRTRAPPSPAGRGYARSPAPSRGSQPMATRPALPGPGRAAPSPAEADRNEPSGAERSRTGAEPSGTGAVRKGSEQLGAVRLGTGGSRGRAGVSAMRRGRPGLRVPGLRVPVPPPPLLLLLLLCPVPGWAGGCRPAAGGGCTPRPPGVTEPCGHTDAHTPQCTDPPGEPVATGDPSPATPKFAPPPPEATGRDIIPVYCSLLAAVVVGLLAYVAFKCWHTCRQKQQLAKARAGDTGPSPDGEKLQSDSGVFLDTPGLQEPHPPGKPPHPQGPPLGAASPQRQEELERLLETGGTRGHQLRPLPAGPQGLDVTSAV
ncbi:basic proline-rich protein-like [Caloenas nicobarica]|uniref:basic proline-rich protein-like n=1 Tax=Caloenas nicobarica TaxID=187106 RepID=UPI0032B83447